MIRRIQTSSSVLNKSRRRIQSDNICLIPASQLPFRRHWETVANSLPSGEVVLVVPKAETPIKHLARQLIPQLRARGHHISAHLAISQS